ncbi:hypothetical protein KSP40_PGU004627 [Platanthera guangdongensis]|uniref:Uncharacterized protein n=1 Tax=Platanthera guangdongensis TaxID=2320717 RepID=A0ABR2MHA1_9ASPA
MATLVLLLSELIRPENAGSAAVDRLLTAYSSQRSPGGSFSGERTAAKTEMPAWLSPGADRREIGDNLQDLRVSVESIWF